MKHTFKLHLNKLYTMKSGAEMLLKVCSLTSLNVYTCMEKQIGRVDINKGGLGRDPLIIYVSYAQVRHHQLELLYEVYTSCIFCEEANSKAKHHPAPIGNLILRSPAKDSASK